jgi:hypothetical protein
MGNLKKLMPRFKKMIKKNGFLKIQTEASAVGKSLSCAQS